MSNIWEAMASKHGLFKTKQDIDDYLCSLTPDSRAIFLAHALRFSLDQALKSDAEFILMDGYCYKYFAPELTLGANELLIDALVSTFPVPDLTICLEASVELTSSRKDEITRYECGIVEKADRAAFKNFQQKVAQAWSHFKNPQWKYIDVSNSKEETLERATAIILGA